MRYEWSTSVPVGGSRLEAIPDDYDGWPTPNSLVFDFQPRLVTPDRIAAAATLAFLPYMSGTINFPAAVSPEFASAVQRLLGDVPAYVSPVDTTAKQLSLGTATFHLDPHFEGTGMPSDLHSGRHILVQMPLSSESFGVHYRKGLLVLPTNAELFETPGDEPLAKFLPQLAVAVLVAQEFEVGTVELPVRTADSALANGVRALLATVGLSLRLPVSVPI